MPMRSTEATHELEGQCCLHGTFVPGGFRLTQARDTEAGRGGFPKGINGLGAKGRRM